MTSAADRVVELLAALAKADEEAVLASLSDAHGDNALFAAALRPAIFHTSSNSLYYKKLLNIWSSRGRPSLKPSSRRLIIELICDCTIQGIRPYLELFCGAFGINAVVEIAPFDSVEQTSIAPPSDETPDVSIVLLSEHWLKKHASGALMRADQVASICRNLDQIIIGLKTSRSGYVVIGNFGLSAWPLPAAAVCGKGTAGLSAGIEQINHHLRRHADARICILDVALSLHISGGGSVSPRLAYLRARAFSEEKGLIQIAREAAAGIAQLFGRSHRALLTDWDNTLWGGEVGELGFHNIVCGQDNPDALAYQLLQSFIAGLTELGVLVAALSRNDPSMAAILDENSDLALRRNHFSSLALSWGNKSSSVTKIESDLKFGSDLMVYIDDNIVDLAEVLLQFPYIDIIIAGPTADLTLSRLTSPRFFNALQINDDDLSRHARATALLRQNQAMAAASSPEDFIKSLEIQLSVSPVNRSNISRVVALLQKTNQFNVTTRRHSEADLVRLEMDGAHVGVFSYSDKFGSQGIIGLIILLDKGENFEIDTWLMSCRVLNRNVEQGMFSWVKERAGDRSISASYIPTEKNGLVKHLFDGLDFDLVAEDGGRRVYLRPGCRARKPSEQSNEPKSTEPRRSKADRNI